MNIPAPYVEGSSLTFFVIPALPAGLSLHSESGAITGTAIQRGSEERRHVVTAMNSVGIVSFGIKMRVIYPPADGDVVANITHQIVQKNKPMIQIKCIANGWHGPRFYALMDDLVDMYPQMNGIRISDIGDISGAFADAGSGDLCVVNVSVANIDYGANLEVYLIISDETYFPSVQTLKKDVAIVASLPVGRDMWETMFEMPPSVYRALTPLPHGLMLDIDTGIISGTPSANETTDFECCIEEKSVGEVRVHSLRYVSFTIS